jgi:hypothetical protein
MTADSNRYEKHHLDRRGKVGGTVWNYMGSRTQLPFMECIQ